MNKALFQSKPSDLNVEKNFEDGFSGALKMSTDEFGGQSVEYCNFWTKNNKIDSLKKAFIAKIDTQTGGAGTAGTALVPVYPDPSIVDRTIKETPLRNLVPRRAMKGLTYDYIPLTSKGGAVWAFENAAIADQVDVFDRVSVPVKYLYAKGRTSGPAIAGMRGFVDPQAIDLAIKSTSILEAEEDALINGDAATNPEEPSGLIVSITTNATNMSGTQPTLAQLRAQIALSVNNNGNIQLAVTDITTHNWVKGLLLDLQRQVTNPSMATLGFGIPDAFEFDRLMFISDKFMPTGASAKRILFLDMRYIFIAELQPLTYEEKASENDSYVYLLKEYLTIVVTHEAAQTQMYGIL